MSKGRPRIPNEEGVEIRSVDRIKVYLHQAEYAAPFTVESSTSFINLARMIEAAARRGAHILYIEIGCDYGFRLCQLARYIKNIAREYEIFAFATGRASQLVPFTLLKNGLICDVNFFHVDELFTNYIGSDNTGLGSKWHASCVIDRIDKTRSDPVFVRVNAACLEAIGGADSCLPQMALMIDLLPESREKRHEFLRCSAEIQQTHHILEIRSDSGEDIIAGANTFLARAYNDDPPTAVAFIPKMFPYLFEPFRFC